LPIKIHRLESPRLLLRQWQAEDFSAFATMNADPEVMEFFPDILTRSESDAAVQRYQSHIAEFGWGFWACEHRANKKFIGVVGLNPMNDLPIGDGIEVGWRLSKDHWGKAYATEAGLASLEFAFNTLGLQEVVSITSLTNRRSQRVMEKLGMVNSNRNFMHPRVAEDSELREHVLYSMSRKQFENRDL
jgi:RimJ/RimL family protein N-acetyltransferase